MTTKLLLHCNSGLPLVEETGRPVSSYNGLNGVSYRASPTIFNGGAAFVGGYDGYFSVPASSDFAFGTGDFKIRFFVKFSAVAGFAGVIVDNLSGSTGFRLSLPDGASIRFDAGSTVYSEPYSFATSTNYFVDVTRVSGVLKFSVSGSQVGSDHACADDITASSSPLYIGGNGTMYSSLYGTFDELYITSGTGVLSDQSVPTVEIPYPDAIPITVIPQGFVASSFGTVVGQMMIQVVGVNGFKASGFGAPNSAQSFTATTITGLANGSKLVSFGTPVAIKAFVPDSMGVVSKFGKPAGVVSGNTAYAFGFKAASFGTPSKGISASQYQASGFYAARFGLPIVLKYKTATPSGFLATKLGTPGPTHEPPVIGMYAVSKQTTIFIEA